MNANQWPTQAQCGRYYGAPGNAHVRLTLPFKLRIAWDKRQSVSTFVIHKRCHDSAARAFQKIRETYSDKEIAEIGIDLFGGCYNNRPMRGGTNLSMHAYACAIDFDPERNQLKWGRDKARLAKPDAVPFWEAWEAEGWVSLGRARNFDWMHVQAARL
jgi:hypothetical protein